MKRILIAMFVLLSARAVFAVDGQVLINQATVMAAGGFPYKITQPGSYKLSGNLVGPLNTSVVVILSSNVILDLNGFNVRCSYTPAGGSPLPSCINDNNFPLTAITIRNGSVTAVGTAPTFSFANFIIAVSMQASVGSVFESVHFNGESTNYSINGLASGAYSIIRLNTFSNAAGPSIGCPSLVENNVNQTGGAGSNGTGCKYIDNVGLF